MDPASVRSSSRKSTVRAERCPYVAQEAVHILFQLKWGDECFCLCPKSSNFWFLFCLHLHQFHAFPLFPLLSQPSQMPSCDNEHSCSVQDILVQTIWAERSNREGVQKFSSLTAVGSLPLASVGIGSTSQWAKFVYGKYCPKLLSYLYEYCEKRNYILQECEIFPVCSNFLLILFWWNEDS